jgi:predicted nucleic-acid-binding protein
MATKPDALPEHAFIDTNLLLRFLLDDLPEQSNAVDRLFDLAATGQIKLVTNALVIAEVVWVLSSVYKASREGIRERVLSILHAPGIEIGEASLLQMAINDYVEKNVGFIDAFNAAWARKEGITDVYTFDRRHYSRFPGIRVLAPT